MSWLLSGSEIRAPNQFQESNSTQVSQNRVLSGAFGRDYFGSKKRIWALSYENINVTDYNIINTLYNTHLSTGLALTWQVTEANYTVSSTSVHVDLLERAFRVKGSDYLSSFALILTEA